MSPSWAGNKRQWQLLVGLSLMKVQTEKWLAKWVEGGEQQVQQ